MSKTVSFVARDELAEWLESRAEDQMKSIFGRYDVLANGRNRREKQAETGKPEQTGVEDDPEPEPLESRRQFSFASKREADAVRTQFNQHLSDKDDKRMTEVWFAEGTPNEVVKELERRSGD